MCAQRLSVIFETRIVAANVASRTPIHLIFAAKRRDNDLFDARAATFQRGALGVTVFAIARA
jgi:hypothetical protein